MQEPELMLGEEEEKDVDVFEDQAGHGNYLL